MCEHDVVKWKTAETIETKDEELWVAIWREKRNKKKTATKHTKIYETTTTIVFFTEAILPHIHTWNLI